MSTFHFGEIAQFLNLLLAACPNMICSVKGRLDRFCPLRLTTARSVRIAQARKINNPTQTAEYGADSQKALTKSVPANL